MLRVGDTLAGLTALGQLARARGRARVVAVTGSVGKTGTKEALRLALGACGRVFASSGSLNNQWGVPLSLARMPSEIDLAVFEIGMNHPGEIAALTRLVRPHIAVITTVEPAHLGFFRSVEEIADAKAEIFLGLEPGGAAILNRDNPHYARLAAAARVIAAKILGFGANPEAAIRLVDCGRSRTAAPSKQRSGRGHPFSPECPRPSLGDELARRTGRRDCRRLRPAARGRRLRRASTGCPGAAAAMNCRGWTVP